MASLLVIRADAGTEIGAGHVMRCLALAQAWLKRGGTARFVMSRPPEALHQRLRGEGIQVAEIRAAAGSVADATETAALASDAGAPWIVVDGYHFGPRYQDALTTGACRVLFIDDYGHGAPHSADLVLNQNIYADERPYRGYTAGTRLLLGPDYLLLRQEFEAVRGWSRPVAARATRILVTMGGGDAGGRSEQVAEAIRSLDDPDLHAIVVSGTLASSGAGPTEPRAGGDRIEVRGSVTSMPELMMWADVGVTAGGTTCYEAALLGLPCLAVVTAANQQAVVDALVAAGVVRALAAPISFQRDLERELVELLADHAARARMAAAGPRLIRGGGADRVIDAMAGIEASSFGRSSRRRPGDGPA